MKWTKVSDTEYVSGQWRLLLKQETAPDTGGLEMLWNVYGPDDDPDDPSDDSFGTVEEAQRYAEKQVRKEVNKFEKLFTKLERADGVLWKAAFGFLDALSQYEETTDVDELYGNCRALNPGITIRKWAIEAMRSRLTLTLKDENDENDDENDE